MALWQFQIMSRKSSKDNSSQDNQEKEKSSLGSKSTSDKKIFFSESKSVDKDTIKSLITLLGNYTLHIDLNHYIS